MTNLERLDKRLEAARKRHDEKCKKMNYKVTPPDAYVDGLLHTKKLNYRTPDNDVTVEPYRASGLVEFLLNIIAFICVVYTGLVIGVTAFTLGIPLLWFTIDPAGATVVYGSAFITMMISGWLLESDESPIRPIKCH